MWENVVERDRPQITIWRTHFSCCTTMTTTHTENMWYLWLVHGNNGYANAPQFYTYFACRVCYLTLLYGWWMCNDSSIFLHRWSEQNRNGMKVLKQAGELSFQITFICRQGLPVLQPRVRKNRDTAVKPSDWSTQCRCVLHDGDILWSFCFRFYQFTAMLDQYCIWIATGSSCLLNYILFCVFLCPKWQDEKWKW